MAKKNPQTRPNNSGKITQILLVIGVAMIQITGGRPYLTSLKAQSKSKKARKPSVQPRVFPNLRGGKNCENDGKKLRVLSKSEANRTKSAPTWRNPHFLIWATVAILGLRLIIDCSYYPWKERQKRRKKGVRGQKFRLECQVVKEADGAGERATPSMGISSDPTKRYCISKPRLWTIFNYENRIVPWCWGYKLVCGDAGNLTLHTFLSSHYSIQSSQKNSQSKKAESHGGAMEGNSKGKNPYKKALCSEKKVTTNTSASEQMSNETDVSEQQKTEQILSGAKPGKFEQKSTEVEETIISAKTPNLNKASTSGTKKEKGKEKLKIDMKAYLAKLVGVKENIMHLKETSLYCFVIGEPLDLIKQRTKLRKEWDIHGDLFIHEKANGWYVLRVTNPIEKNGVWEERPHHIFGQLMILKPWTSNFDTAKESISQVDTWIRIPHLPAEYLSFDVLSTIIEMNNKGHAVKLDRFTEEKKRVAYARVCINVDLLSITDNILIVPDEEANEHEYKIWFEDSPRGCGYCGDEEHEYESCPMRTHRNKSIRVTLSKPSAAKTPRTNTAEPKEKEDEGEWEQVSYSKSKDYKGKGVLPPSQEKRNTGIQLLYKTDSSSAESKSSKVSKELESLSEKKAEPIKGKSEVEANGEPSMKPETPPLNDEDKKEGDEDSQFEFLNEIFMNEEEGEFTQEEIAAYIENEFGYEAPMEESQPMDPQQSLANTSSVVQKLEEMDVLRSQASKSESSKRKDSSGMFDTATSEVKGGGPKKQKKVA